MSADTPHRATATVVHYPEARWWQWHYHITVNRGLCQIEDEWFWTRAGAYRWLARTARREAAKDRTITTTIGGDQ